MIADVPYFVLPLSSNELNSIREVEVDLHFHLDRNRHAVPGRSARISIAPQPSEPRQLAAHFL